MEGTLIMRGGSTLMAVPAIHYKEAFAKEVNALCTNHSTRPDAIAVELGPHKLGEISAFLKQLGVSPDRKFMLPCMLGILAPTRFIHPDRYTSAIFLQQHFRKPLDFIPTPFLKQVLCYSKNCLVGLSSTDSIIEAIRCSIELDIPVYGVDLEDFAMGPSPQLLLEDPEKPEFELHQYVARHERAAETVRDKYIDSRRELVMAARLKTLMNNHKKILFTCGLAHWNRIRYLLADHTVRPAGCLSHGQPPVFRRVILHPKIALAFMDSYPVNTTLYEFERTHPLKGRHKVFPPRPAEYAYQNILQTTFREFLELADAHPDDLLLHSEKQKFPELERLLCSMRLVHPQHHPSLTDLLEATSSMMCPDFQRLLTDNIMKIMRSWASQALFPELPVLYNNAADAPARSKGYQADTYRLTPSKGGTGSPFSSPDPHESFYVTFSFSKPSAEDHFGSWHWKHDPVAPKSKTGYNSWVWPPCEALLFGAAYKAAKIVQSETRESIAAVFEGSLHEGLDIKATARSMICGENKTYIRKPFLVKRISAPDGKHPDPTVFIFGSGTDQSYWSLLMGGSSLGNHVRNTARYQEVVSRHGSSFISSISIIHTEPTPNHLKDIVDSISIIDGVTAFGSPCMNSIQGAQWVEENDFNCCPVLNGSTIELLINSYKVRHHMKIDTGNWQHALIRFAIPFAKERVVVIAPDAFRIPSVLIGEARQRNISLSLLPLSYFPASAISEMRKRIFVGSSDPDGLIFPPVVEHVLGQKADQYRELLPPYMQQQLNRI